MSSLIPSQEDARQILAHYISPQKILDHCIATQQKAIRIAAMVKLKIAVDIELVSVGALLHDIGRARVHDITHGVVGGEILREEGASDRVIRIVERHVLGGFTASEALCIGLPHRSFLPETWEERIVCVADKLGLYYWREINSPAKWLSKVQERFTELQRVYGGGEPFATSMRRGEQYAGTLARVALQATDNAMVS